MAAQQSANICLPTFGAGFARLAPALSSGPGRRDRKRVVQVGKYYAPFVGGIENNTKQVAEALKGSYESSVLCMRHPGAAHEVERVNGVLVIRLPGWKGVSRQQVTAPLGPILERLAPDAIHFHAPNPLWALYVRSYLLARPKTRLIVTHHADLERPAAISLVANHGYRWLLSRADRIVTYTQAAYSASRELKAFAHKSAVVPHGTDVQGAARALRRGPARRDCGAFIVGYLGRLERWKGVQTLLEAVAMMPGVTLRIAGDGSYRRQLEFIAEDLGVADRTEFFGELSGDSKWNFLGQLDAMVLPSLNNGETFGQVLVEAQMMKVPVVASDLPTGIQDIVEEGRSGFLFEPGNAKSLKKALLLLTSEDLRGELATKACERAHARFTADAAVAQIRELYGSMLHG